MVLMFFGQTAGIIQNFVFKCFFLLNFSPDFSFSSKIRLVNKGQIHLTLKFLGEVQPDKAEKVKEELKKIKFKPFSVYLDSTGVFPSESYIRVVWIGLKPENDILELQSNIPKIPNIVTLCLNFRDQFSQFQFLGN